MGQRDILDRLPVLRSEWLLDPDIVFLNHGSFGAAPRCVLAEQDRWRERMERRPTTFMTFELPQALRDAAAKLAAFVGCDAKDLGFVENATAGCNAVLNSLTLRQGDEILVTDHGYRAVRNAAEHAAKRAGARVVEAVVPFPLQDPTQVVEAVTSRLSPRTRLVVLDHVTSPTAVVFPLRELVAACRDGGAVVLIDGAHAPGMVDLDIRQLGVDWYVGNCHKWLMAPKGAGFLYADPQRQAGLHPPVISHGYDQGFTAEFDWIGTRDPSAWLAVPAALDFHARLGGPRLRERNIALARQSGAILAQRWGTPRGAPDVMTGSMAAVRLPLDAEPTRERAIELRKWLLDTHHIEAAIMPFAGALWARVSVQAYNEPADIRRLADAFQT
jgi:isopenicillin-N epimerase